MLYESQLSSVAGKTAPLLVVDDSTCLPLQLRQTLLFSTAMVQAGTVFRQMVRNIFHTRLSYSLDFSGLS
jgi:hypothetical protein